MIHLILVIAMFGLLTWIITQIPMPQIFRNIIIAIVSFILVLWVLQVFGVETGFRHLKF